MNKTDQKIIKTKAFKEVVEALLDKIRKNRHHQMRVNDIKHPKRDTFARMDTANALNAEFFAREGALLFERKSRLNAEFRKVVEGVCEEVVKQIKDAKKAKK